MGGSVLDSGLDSVRNALEGRVGNVIQAGRVDSVHFHASPKVESAPSQLPPAPAGFVARERELTELDHLYASASRAVTPIVVSGIGGVGKTSLALRWMESVSAQFDDGQLFVDLTDAATGEPVRAADVLEWFLLSLGIAAERVPVEPQRRAALYRSVTASRQLVVLLDNAVSAAQVRPLIPAGAGSAVVVTSRSRLTGLALDGARWVDLEPLDEADSLRLLGSVVGGGRVGTESDAAGQVARLCGGLPLALSVVAARLAARGRRTFAREVAELRSDRLTGLTLDQETSVEIVLDVSCSALDDEAQAVYEGCAWHPGREFGLDVVAAALGWAPARAERALDGLLEASMVSETAESRFALHDLVRIHARRLGVLDGEAVRHDMVEWYLDRAVAADVAVHPLRPRLAARYRDVSASPFADAPEAIGWLEAERANLRAAVDAAVSSHDDEVVWQFCEALWGFFLHTRRYGEWIDLQLVGIDSAQRCGNRRAEALLRNQLGYALVKTGRAEEAMRHNTIALELARAEQDLPAQATALEQLGLAAKGDDPDRALAYFRESLELNERIERPRGVALCRRRIGETLADLGRPEEAVAEFAAVAEVMARLGDATQHARAMTVLAATCLRLGRPEHAERVLREAMEAMRAFGSPYYQAEILAVLGDVAEHHGDRAAAVRWWTSAAALYEQVDEVKAQVMLERAADPVGPHRT
jgi:tetratricopeptide (TPR) repeat protein